MAIRKRPGPAEEPPEDLLDLPLDHVPGGEDDTPTSPAPRPAAKRDLGDVGAIGSLESRRTRRGRFGWLWLVLLLAIPLSGLVGYLLKIDPPVAALSTELLDFGEVRLGAAGSEQTLRVSNQGEQALRVEAAAVAGDAAAEFRIAADGCTGMEILAQADCVLRLAFEPVDRGARRARIRLDSNAPGGPQTVPLIGVGVAPELTLEPSELDFPEQSVGTSGAPVTLRLGNRGTAPLQLGRVVLQGPGVTEYRTVADGCSSRLLPAGERCSLRLAFTPKTAGDHRAELLVESDDGAPRRVPLSGRAVLRLAILRIEPSPLDFEPLPVAGVSPRRTLTLANDGNGSLTVETVRIDSDPEAGGGPFEVVAESCTAHQVPPGGACEIELRFTATVEGQASAALLITSSVGGEPERIPLAGAGIAPHATVRPERLSFGEVAVKATSKPRAVRVISSGSDQLVVEEITVTGPDASAFSGTGDCVGGAVAPGTDCRLEVTFRPGRAGPHRADLLLRHNADNRRYTLPLNGIGVAARLSLDRTAIDFGDTRVGAETRQRLTLTNAGRSDLEILRMRLTGRQEDFELDAAQCVTAASGASLGPSASCTATITFRPTSAGSRRLELVIDHTAAQTPRQVAISARGTAPAVPAIRLEPLGFAFPDRRVGDRSTIETLTVSNPGTARLNLGESTIDGANSGDFQLVPGSCASFVAPGASCTLGVRFVPAAVGPRTARWLIRHNAAGGTAELELSGTGTQPPPP